MLEEYIKSNNCFKLILGANNENYEEIKRLTALYALAGCKFFDINASNKAIEYCKQGLIHSKKQGYICISIGTKSDPHLTKCKIDYKKCTGCLLCKEVCIQNAIISDSSTVIDEKKCIGCKKCFNICPKKAIESYQKEIDFKKIIEQTKDLTDCIEFHIITQNKEEIFEKWKYLAENYKGYLSIALNRAIFSDKDIKEILFKMLNLRSKNVMIQADGAPMSGGCDDFNTTLQAVSTADIIRKLGIQVPIIVSGGTNSKTRYLANLCNIDIQGVAIGSWARKQVRELIDTDDFFENKEVFNQALNIAKSVVNSTIV